MKSPEPEIIQLLVHGGPGTGKSYLTSCIYQKALEMGYFI
jgi:DNA replication protein DnaC